MGGNWVCLDEPQVVLGLLSHPGLLTICPPPPFPLRVDTCQRSSWTAGPWSHFFLTPQCPATINDLELSQTPGPASCWADWDRTGSPNQEAKGWVRASQLGVITYAFREHQGQLIQGSYNSSKRGRKERRKGRKLTRDVRFTDSGHSGSRASLFFS